MVAIYPGISSYSSENMPNAQKAVLVRNLKDWRWELRDKRVALINKKTGNELVLDKVRLMSFIKFAPNCLDKMRIEESKKLQARIKKVIEKYIARIKEIRKRYKEKKAQNISSRARKVEKNG